MESTFDLSVSLFFFFFFVLSAFGFSFLGG
jgi:hypothetical protein